MDIFRRELLAVRLQLLERRFDAAYASLMKDFRRGYPAAAELWTLESFHLFLETHRITLSPAVLESLIRGLIFSKFPTQQAAISLDCWKCKMVNIIYSRVI